MKKINLRFLILPILFVLFAVAANAQIESITEVKDVKPTDKYYKAFENCESGTALFMSSKGQENSLEDSGLRSGVFSHFLIKGLKGEADADHDKIISIEELYDYVKLKVSKYTAGAQTPVLTGKYDGKLPVGVVR